MGLRHKDTIMVHCLDTPKSWAVGKTAQQMIAEVRRWHVEDNGWKDVAYAELCAPDGTSAKGRDLDGDGDVWSEVGAGAKGWNTRAIHLVLAGGKGSSADDEFLEHFTVEQGTWLRAKIAEIEKAAGRKMQIMGHNQVAAKACPGFNVPRWYEQKPPRSIASSKTIWSTVTTSLGSVIAAVSQLHEHSQAITIVVAGVILLASIVIFRERLKYWARGIK